MQALSAKAGEGITFSGIGGSLMEKQGLQSLFPMHEISVMGIFEVLPNLIQILKRIKQTVENIEFLQPDIILTIDSPDFTLRVMEKVQKRGKSTAKRIHCVAPTVWAWRPKRAKKMAQVLDKILCLFPFEPKYFEKENLPAVFIGHPVLESGLIEADGHDYRDDVGISPSEKVIGAFLGSRRGELKRTAPHIRDALAILLEGKRNYHIVVPTLPHLQEHVFHMLKDLPVPVHITSDPREKWSAFKSCDIAIATSGTVGLELAVAGVPHVIAYRMSPLTFAVLKRMVKVKYAHLANILLNTQAIPEFIQARCKGPVIAETAKLLLLKHSDAYARQIQVFDRVKSLVSPGEGLSPSEKAADSILSS